MEEFDVKYEEQKIPEWYDMYFDYRYIKTNIKFAKEKIKSKSRLLITDFRRRGSCQQDSLIHRS